LLRLCSAHVLILPQSQYVIISIQTSYSIQHAHWCYIRTPAVSTLHSNFTQINVSLLAYVTISTRTSITKKVNFSSEADTLKRQRPNKSNYHKYHVTMNFINSGSGLVFSESYYKAAFVCPSVCLRVL
jgi:hypothetical protein